MTMTALSVSVGSYHFMNSMARPTYNQGTLVDSGVDLNMEAGMAEWVMYFPLAFLSFCGVKSWVGYFSLV